MSFVKKTLAVVLAACGFLGIVGVASSSTPKSEVGTLIVLAALIAAGGLLWWSGARDKARAATVIEVQKLLALAEANGTLSPARVQVGLAMTKEEAEAALQRLKGSGLAEFDVDENGAPVYRVQKAALEARQARRW